MTNSPLDTDSSSPTPFFIVGAQRSGTTMLRLMLNQHPEIVVPFESGFITVFYRKLGKYGELSNAENLRRLLSDIQAYPLVKKGQLIGDPAAVLAHPIHNYADLVRAIFATHAHDKGKQRWGDKTPSYVTDLEVLWALFPGCHIIHMVRDGRDVALSNRSLEWGIRSLPRAAEDWRWKTVLGHKIGTVLGRHYLELRYEELVLRTEYALGSVCDFLRVPYDSRMLAYPETGAREMPKESLDWHRNSVKAPNPSLVYNWKQNMSIADRIIFEQIAGDALDIFGYEREGQPSTLGSRLKNLYYSTLQRW
jgi:hypothetical protein